MTDPIEKDSPKKVAVSLGLTASGFEELAIAEKFGVTLEEIENALRTPNGTDVPKTARGTSARVASARVAVFVSMMRDGQSADDAYTATMNMSVPDLSEIIDKGQKDDADPLESPPAS